VSRAGLHREAPAEAQVPLPAAPASRHRVLLQSYDRSRLEIDGSDDDCHECADHQARLPNRH
jgi:hypothetical protein